MIRPERVRGWLHITNCCLALWRRWVSCVDGRVGRTFLGTFRVLIAPSVVVISMQQQVLFGCFADVSSITSQDSSASRFDVVRTWLQTRVNNTGGLPSMGVRVACADGLS